MLRTEGVSACPRGAGRRGGQPREAQTGFDSHSHPVQVDELHMDMEAGGAEGDKCARELSNGECTACTCPRGAGRRGGSRRMVTTSHGDYGALMVAGRGLARVPVHVARVDVAGAVEW
eukprot:6974941-Prymnesium_polylepis.1